MKRLKRLMIPVGMLALPTISFAQATNSFQSLANTIAKILNAGALLLITATIVLYFYSIVGSIMRLKEGKVDSTELRKTIFVGLGIIFVMVSIWGIIQILQNSLFGGPGPAASNGVIIYGH
jgi:hypothetical protein